VSTEDIMSNSSNLILKVLGVGSCSLAIGLAGCSQEGVSCQTAHGDFAVKLFLKTDTGACSENIGGVYGVNSYQYPDKSGEPDLNRGSVAIQSEDLGVLLEDAEARTGTYPDLANSAFAKGDWAGARPNSDGMCVAPTLVKAQKSIPALDLIPAVIDDPTTPDDDESADEVPAEPAKAFAYEWSNLSFLVTAAANGTQFVGNLKYTADGCTAEYEAWGLYPAVFCEDADGNPDDRLCNAEADPANGIPVGSGINPDFTTVCDPDLLLCMLTSRPPTE